MKKVTKGYVNRFDVIKFIDTLPSGRHVYEIYTRVRPETMWTIMHSTDSTYHICPYDGIFRNCSDCGANAEDFDVQFCLDKLERISSEALAERCTLCEAAQVPITYTTI